MLTHTKILGAKPKEKPYKLTDADRLYVLVTTTGKKYWKWNYRLDGKDSTYTLGTFPAVTLGEARKRRIDAEGLVATGIHPADADYELKLKNLADKAGTFWALTEEWIATRKSTWSPYYLSQVESFMRRYVRDAPIGNRPVNKVTEPEIIALISGVAKRTKCIGDERKASGAPSVAILLRMWCKEVFRLAVRTHRAERNPLADTKPSDLVHRPPVKSNLSLSKSQLQGFLTALDTFTGQRTTGIAIELLMLTLLRTGELRCATWDEIDFQNSQWTIPSSRMKIKTAGDHIVPLSTQAVNLLKELKAICGDQVSAGKHWAFQNTRRENDCMSATTVNRALERMGFNGKETIGFSAHGFRGTGSTHLHEIGFRPDVIEVQLAHHERSQTKAAYNKAKYLKQRAFMLQYWADFIEGLRSGITIPPPKGMAAWADA